MKRPWIAALATGVGAVAAAIVVPSVVISAYAAGGSDPQQVTRFAVRVAEPLALLGACAATVAGAWLATRARGRRVAEGLLVGAAAAACIVAAAFWVGDVDRWTAAASGLLPVAGVVGSWLAGRRGPPARPAELPLPEPHLSQAPEWNRSSSVPS